MKFNFRIKKIKLQSVMEFLITHVWALLIIAIALVALFELGVLTPHTIQQCTLSDEIICQSYTLSTQGVLTLTLENSGTTPINITGFACYQSASNINYQKEGNLNGQIYLGPGGITNLYTNCYTSTNVYNSLYGNTYVGNLSITYIDSRTGIAGNSYGTISVAASTPSSNYEPGAVFSVQIIITNNENSPTSNDFQQQLVINPSQYVQYGLYSNMSNIQFSTGSYGSGQELYSWIENGSSSTSTISNIWVNIPDIIPGNGGTQTIYMNIFSNNDPVLLGYTGYAPQLYCSSGCFQTSYAEYDNGVNVFQTYSNFKGTTLNPIFYSPQSCSGGLTVNNEYTMNTVYCQYQYQTLVKLNLNSGYGGILLSNVNSIVGPGDVIWCWLRNGGCNPGLNVENGPIEILSQSPISNQQLYTIDSLGSNTITNFRTFTLDYIGIATYPPDGYMPTVTCNIGTCSN
ncbi:MAG: hypothetical protein QXD23_02910 [Candidatus Micrarchaeaceae archaeon]